MPGDGVRVWLDCYEKAFWVCNYACKVFQTTEGTVEPELLPPDALLVPEQMIALLRWYEGANLHHVLRATQMAARRGYCSTLSC